MAEQEQIEIHRRFLRGQCNKVITLIKTFMIINDYIGLASVPVPILLARKHKLMCALQDFETVQQILSSDDGDSEEVRRLLEEYYAVLAKINASLKQIADWTS